MSNSRMISKTDSRLNQIVVSNFKKVGLSSFLILFFVVGIILIFLFTQNALSVQAYPIFQENLFYKINHYLGQFPNLEWNLTQTGDALIAMSLLSILFIYAPKIWEALIVAFIASGIFSYLLKTLFSIPRPSLVFDNDNFNIIGKRLVGYSSLPSGHSITIFTTLIILMIAFLPKKFSSRLVWCISILAIGIFLIFTRVAVGAHYPLDTVFGALVGTLSALIGIVITRKFRFLNWINNQKFYPIFAVIFLAGSAILISKIVNSFLPIYILPLICLIISIYILINVYIKNFIIKK